jgi:hypothetical protein
METENQTVCRSGASKPINDLDEAAIISWWGNIQYDPIIDYDHNDGGEGALGWSKHYAAPSDGSLASNECGYWAWPDPIASPVQDPDDNS